MHNIYVIILLLDVRLAAADGGLRRGRALFFSKTPCNNLYVIIILL
jgi:hypothetical protein